MKGKAHALLDPCTKTSRLYALPTDAFPLGARAATADDVSIGAAGGGGGARDPAGARCDRSEEADRALREGPARAADGVSVRHGEGGRGARGGSGDAGVAAVHEVLAVEGFDATRFVVRTVRVVYTYEDGGSETVGAGAGAGADASASASASASADARMRRRERRRRRTISAHGGCFSQLWGGSWRAGGSRIRGRSARGPRNSGMQARRNFRAV